MNEETYPVGIWYEKVKDIISPQEGILLEKTIPHITPDMALTVTAAFLAGKKWDNHE